jgi:hypothetical protein
VDSVSAGAVEITGMVVVGVLILAGLATVAVAREWINVTASASVKAVPAAKRQPRNAIEVRHVLPDAAEQTADLPKIAAARRTAT